MDDLGVVACPHHPPPAAPGPRCRGCQLAGLVPFPDDMPPPDPPAALGESPATAAPPAPARCRRLGAEPVGLRDCPSCAGHVRRKEFACALQLGTGGGGAACPPVDCPPSRACPGYESAPGDEQQ